MNHAAGERILGADRDGSDAALADPDRVDLHLHGLGDVGRGIGIDLAAVVGTVGDENDHLGLRLRLAQAGQRGGEAGADGGAVGQPVEGHVFELAKEKGLIGGGRGLRDGPAGEDDEADPVARALSDEVRDHRLGHGEAVVGLKVHGGHRARDVERHHDVDALGGELVAPETLLRPGQGDHDQGEREGGEPLREGAESGADGARQAPGHGRARKRKGGLQGLEPAREEGEKKRQGQQDQHPGGLELEGGEAHADFLRSCWRACISISVRRRRSMRPTISLTS